MFTNPFRKRWIIVMVGRHSDRRVPVRFLRFRTETAARDWIAARSFYGDTITYEVDKLP